LNIKLNLNLEKLAAAVLNFLEMMFHEGVSKDVQNDLIYMNDFDLLVFASTSFSIILKKLTIFTNR